MDMSSGDHRIDARGAGALFDIGIYCIAPFLLLAGRDPVGMAATATRNELGVDIVMSGWIDWGRSPSGDGFSSAFDVSFDAPLRKQMALTGERTASSTFPGEHVPGPSGGEPASSIERRDGSVETVECAGANAYAGHGRALRGGGRPAGDRADLRSDRRACASRRSSTSCTASQLVEAFQMGARESWSGAVRGDATVDDEHSS